MRSTMVLVAAVIRASDERGSELNCPISILYAIRKMQATCGSSVPSGEKLRYDRNASGAKDRSRRHRSYLDVASWRGDYPTASRQVVCESAARTSKRTSATVKFELTATAIRQMLDGMWVTTIVLTRPTRLASHAETENDKALNRLEQKKALAAPSDRSNCRKSHRASKD